MATAINSELVTYSDLPMTLDALILEASSLTIQSIEQTIIKCSKIRDMILAIIDVTKDTIDKLEVKDSEIKKEILSSESEYSRNHQRLLSLPGLIQQKSHEKRTHQHELDAQTRRFDEQIKDYELKIAGIQKISQFLNTLSFSISPPEEKKFKQEIDKLKNSKISTKDRFTNLMSSLDIEIRRLIEEEKILNSKKEIVQEKLSLLYKNLVTLRNVHMSFSITLNEFDFLSRDVRLIESFARNSVLKERQLSIFVQKIDSTKSSLPSSHTIQSIL